MLSKTLEDHLDQIEVLEEEAKAIVERVYNKLDIDELIEDPEGALTEAAKTIQGIFEDTIAEKAAKLGFDLSATIKTIKVPDTEDPHLNKEDEDKS